MVSDGNKKTGAELLLMTISTLKSFMKKYNLGDDTRTGTTFKKIYIFSIYPSNSILNIEKRFLKIDDGNRGGTYWSCFYVKDNKTFYSVHLVNGLIHFCLYNYRNRSLLTIMNFRI